MSVFKNDMNKTLLGLLAIHIMMFAAFTIYFQNSMIKIKTEADTKLEENKQVIDSMIKDQLNDVQKLRVINTENKNTFESMYYNALQEIQELKEENEELRNVNNNRGFTQDLEMTPMQINGGLINSS